MWRTTVRTPDGALGARIEAEANRVNRSVNWVICRALEGAFPGPNIGRGTTPTRPATFTGATPPDEVELARADVSRETQIPGQLDLPGTTTAEGAGGLIHDDARPHRHRYTTPVQGTERYLKGQRFQQYSCDCGDLKEQPVR
jgi:hypothetical protein